MNSRKTILFCGGGSLGHIIPSLAVREALLRKDSSLHYHFVCASRQSETDVLRAENVAYSVIHAPKFPRTISLRLISFPFLFIVACIQSLLIIISLKPALVFTKGGYVSIPPALVAWLLRIPVVLHTSDSVPNFSDRIVGSFARKVCTGFPFTSFPPSLRRHAILTGNPVRECITKGSKQEGLSLTGFSGSRPIILVMGGSQGAKRINEAIDRDFDTLVKLADIIHLTGEGKTIKRSDPRYTSWATVSSTLPDLYAVSDLVVSRAGAGALSELAVAKKACIILPLQGVAHDHQVKNAEYLASKDAADIVREHEEHTLASHILALLENAERREVLKENLHKAFPPNAAEKVAAIVLDSLQ